jgi:hypothetical protein
VFIYRRSAAIAAALMAMFSVMSVLTYCERIGKCLHLTDYINYTLGTRSSKFVRVMQVIRKHDTRVACIKTAMLV